MTYGSRVFIDLVVVAALVTHVTPEMDVVVFLLDELEAERFVPSLWEHVKRDLATN